MVRLITHNLLACHAKGCNANNFPLKFQNVQLEVREAELNADFLRGFLPKLEWQALVNTAREVATILSRAAQIKPCAPARRYVPSH